MLEYLEEEKREKENQQLKQRNQIQKNISKQDKKSKKEHKNKKNKKKAHSSSSSSLVSLPSPQIIEDSKKHIKKDVKKINDNNTINCKEKNNEIIPLFEIDVEPLTKQDNANLIEYETNGIRRLSTNTTIFERIGKLTEQQVDQDDQQQLNDMDGFDFWTVSRYFNRNPFEQCYRCKQTGHSEKQCVESIKLFCQYCLSQEHTGDKCLSVSCFKCNKIGHRKFECTSRTKYPYCLRCNRVSHRTDACGMLSTYKQNIEITCLKCLNQGHINCNAIQLNDSIY